MKGKSPTDNVVCWKFIKLGEDTPSGKNICPAGKYPKGMIYDPNASGILTADFLDDFGPLEQVELLKSNTVIPDCVDANPTACPDGYSLVGISPLEFFQDADADFPSEQRSKCIFSYADTFAPAATTVVAKKCPILTMQPTHSPMAPLFQRKITYTYDAAANICRKPAGVPTMMDSKILELDEVPEDEAGTPMRYQSRNLKSGVSLLVAIPVMALLGMIAWAIVSYTNQQRNLTRQLKVKSISNQLATKARMLLADYKYYCKFIPVGQPGHVGKAARFFSRRGRGKC